MIDLTKPIELANGEPLTVLQEYITPCGHKAFAALFPLAKGAVVRGFYTDSGEAIAGDEQARNAPAKRGRWHNCYGNTICCPGYDSHHEAVLGADSRCTARIFIDWTDGEGLECKQSN